jgi:hypothetical protein
MDKWNRLQTLAHEKDERLKENRKQWKHFKRQIEDLEQASQQVTQLNNLCKRNNPFLPYFVLLFSTANCLFESGCTS